MHQYKKLIIFITILLVGFLTAITILSWPLLTGKTYILSTQPVDPFDLFRGQYITISYEISRIQNITDVSIFNTGNNAYVSLKKDEVGIFHTSGLSSEKPKGDFIKGTIKEIRGNSVIMEYGIEQYFFERNAEFPTNNLQVEVKVSSSGQARISRLLQNGNPIEIKYS